MQKIEKVENIEAEKLTELTMRSKAYWNYGSEQVEKWRNELTVSKEDIDENEVYKLVVKDDLIGYYLFIKLNEEDVTLDRFFVDPKYIGKGYGKVLMDDCLDRLQKMGFKKVTLNSDPHAEKFYEKVGFKVVGQLESSIKNRFLPIMELEINQIEDT